MAEVWEYCRKLNNEARLDLLRQVYVAEYGLNVGLALDASVLGQSGVSQYMKQLESLGLLKRQSSGRFVNYHPELKAPSIVARALVPLLMERFRSSLKPDMSFTQVFPALMNPLRARIVARLAKKGAMTYDEITDQFDIQARHFLRRMTPILTCGLAVQEDDVYTYQPPLDPIAQTLISLI